MANVLSQGKRLEVLGALVNGCGPSAASRMTDVHRDTIGRFAFAIGVGCERVHDRWVRDLSSPLVDLDEQHSWTRKRQVHIDPERDDTSVMGERWTWASICRVTKLVIAWHVGKRTAESADAVVSNTRARIVVMPQITTDGCPLYVEPIGRHFGYGVDYAQMIKHTSGDHPGKFIERRIIFGAPDMGKVTTYAIERSNLTNRQWNSRLVWRTLCFSKKVDRHDASISLGYVYRNLCHIPKNMRETPAMAAGIVERPWSLEELMVAALEEPAGEKPEARPLTFREPTTTARALPAGRGFMRVVGATGSGAASSPGPAPTPATPAAVTPSPSTDPTGQLDLWAWKPRPARPLPPPGTQMSLFGDPAPGSVA
jgi:IS1 family transposase